MASLPFAGLTSFEVLSFRRQLFAAKELNEGGRRPGEEALQGPRAQFAAFRAPWNLSPPRGEEIPPVRVFICARWRLQSGTQMRNVVSFLRRSFPCLSSGFIPGAREASETAVMGIASDSRSFAVQFGRQNCNRACIPSPIIPWAILRVHFSSRGGNKFRGPPDFAGWPVNFFRRFARKTVSHDELHLDAGSCGFLSAQKQSGTPLKHIFALEKCFRRNFRINLRRSPGREACWHTTGYALASPSTTSPATA